MRKSGIVIFGFFFLSWYTAMADDMDCGEYIISDDEDNGQTQDDIRQKCGEPFEVNGDDWYYKQAEGPTYQVHFNDDGQLESITAQ